MDAIASIPLLGGFLSTVLPFVVVLGIVVFVHEFGHYIVARWCGIRAEVFSIGFGRVIWSRHDKRGTLWQVAALPLGGYVKFVGDADGASSADRIALKKMRPEEEAESFHGASVGRRMLTVAAGPVFNFLLTIVVFAGLALWTGVPTERPTVGSVAVLPGGEPALEPGDVLIAVEGKPVESLAALYAAADAMPVPGPMRVTVERRGETIDVTSPYPLPPIVEGVEPLSPASRAGLEIGDVVTAVAGQPLASFGELRAVVMRSGGQTIPLTVWRDGETVTLSITPTERDVETADGSFERRVMIGVASRPLYQSATVTPAPWTAVGIGVERMGTFIHQSLNGIKSMATGAIGLENLQGPLGIAQISGETATHGFVEFIMLIGVISTAIGLFNLFPIPILDGGHLVAFAIEAVRGRPPSPAIMQVAMSIGLGLILLLMVFATYNDIMRMVS